MSIKVAHVSDVHIRNLKYHDVYEKVFDLLYEDLGKRSPDYIVITGDVAHTKTQISPEYVSMASAFFENLSKIAKTIVIPGNHDGNLKNSSRMDAITPIIKNLNNDNIYFLKESGIIDFDDIDFYHLSVFDRKNWPAAKENDKINVALYHGAVSGVKTDTGFTLEHGDDHISSFLGYDYGMFGDIHKTDQKIDKDGRMRYPGSLITQNFGETNDKGYLLWELEDKEKFKVKHVKLENPKPFISIYLTPTGRLPNKTEIPDGARVRLIASESISLDRMKKVVDIVKNRFSVESVSFLNRSGYSRAGRSDKNDEFEAKNVRDIGVQEELIKEYLEDYKVEDDVMDKICELNKQINSQVESEETTARNINWELKSVEWDNLFNYGPSNKIDFEKLNGIIGIFGKSYSGKSSIVDAMLYTMFNSTSKNVVKNYDMINQHKEYGSGKVKIKIDHKDYVIDRRSDKYTKRLHGEETEEARTEVNFSEVIDEDITPLNGETRHQTDYKIRAQFGTLDDFLVTSMSAQFGSLAFIDQKSTDRKKTLGKFLDLDFFEKKYSEANDRVSDIKGALNLMESKNLDEEFKKYTEKLEKVLESLEEAKGEKKIQEEKCKSLSKKYHDAKKALDAIPKELGEVVKEEKLIECQQKIEKIDVELQGKHAELAEVEKKVKELDNKLEEITSEDDWQGKLEKIEAIEDKLATVSDKLSEKRKVFEQVSEAEENIKNAPCNNEYSDCMMVERAWQTLNEIGSSEKFSENIDKLEQELQDIAESKAALSPVQTREALIKISTIERARSEYSSNKSKILSDIVHLNSLLNDEKSKYDEINTKYKEYKKNKEAFDAKEKVESEYKRIKSELSKCEDMVEKLTNDANDLHSNKGYYEQKIENIHEERMNLEVLRKEYSAYDLYKKCMHSNGIPFDIIKKRLPHINEEISKILTAVVDFEVFFEAQDNKLEVYIKHPKHGPRPIETGSGAEKTLSATAIRLALLAISSLPKGDIFILDEPATELDEDTKEGFIRILDMIKVYFKNVILISHLETLKDVVDTQITIEKKNGYAFVDVS